jgi:GNAT superfamily N-acetyltransferase
LSKKYSLPCVFENRMITYREATLNDWEALWEVRLAVKENALVNTSAVTYQHYADILHGGGRGWVYESDGKIVGFAIVDMLQANIWALFVLPEYAQKGIGRTLHDLMLNWAFSKNIEALWLSTDPGTRAEQFYIKAGWQLAGPAPDGEVRFKMHKSDWKMSAPETSLN